MHETNFAPIPPLNLARHADVFGDERDAGRFEIGCHGSVPFALDLRLSPEARPLRPHGATMAVWRQAPALGFLDASDWRAEIIVRFCGSESPRPIFEQVDGRTDSGRREAARPRWGVFAFERYA